MHTVCLESRSTGGIEQEKDRVSRTALTPHNMVHYMKCVAEHG
jgi:hypothetical protein